MKTTVDKLVFAVIAVVTVLAAVLAAEAIYLGTSVDPFELLHNGSLNDTGAAGLVILMFLTIPALLFYLCIFICGGGAVILFASVAGLVVMLKNGNLNKIYRFNIGTTIMCAQFAFAFGWIGIGLLQTQDTGYELTVAAALLTAAAAVAVVLCVLSIVCAVYLKKQMNAQIMV